jgi:hypothetical protein
LSALPNTVDDTANSPVDLIAFLGSDNTQCYKTRGNGYYKIVAEGNGKFAKMQYGCTLPGGSIPFGPPTYILAIKTTGKWHLISPTDQWAMVNGQELPSCKMVNDNKVSKLVTPECYIQSAPGGSTLTVGQVTNP